MITLITKALKVLTSMRDAKGTLGKNWYRSKTLWIFGIGFVYSLLAWLGFLPPDMQFEGADKMTITNFVGIILRLITNEPVGFIDPESK